VKDVVKARRRSVDPNFVYDHVLFTGKEILPIRDSTGTTTANMRVVTRRKAVTTPTVIDAQSYSTFDFEFKLPCAKCYAIYPNTSLAAGDDHLTYFNACTQAAKSRVL
jgi:hypothetical protein